MKPSTRIGSALRSRRQHRPGQRGDLQPADTRRASSNGVGRKCGMERQRRGDHLALCAASCASSSPVPRPTRLVRIAACQQARARRRRCRVADAHLAEASRSRPLRTAASTRSRPTSIAFCVSARVMAVSCRKLRVPRGSCGRGPGRASTPATPDIHDLQRGPELPGQHIDRRAARREIGDHLRRDDLRIEADPFGDDAVIAGEEQDMPALRPGRNALLDGAELRRQRLQRPQAAERLGFVIEQALRGRAMRLGNRRRFQGFSWVSAPLRRRWGIMTRFCVGCQPANGAADIDNAIGERYNENRECGG